MKSPINFPSTQCNSVAATSPQPSTAKVKLKDLYAKKDEIKKKELLNAVENSDKTYEEIIAFLNGDK